MCCHTTFSKTLYFHVLVVGKLGRLRKSHTTCKRCYLMLLLLDYHIPSFFSKKRQLLALQTPLTYITLYYWYFDVRYTKKYNARRRALYVIMLLFHYYYMQLQCYKRVLEKEEIGKNFRKIIWKKRYASNNVRWNWRQWSCSWYLIWLLSTCTKMVEKSQISGNVPIQFAHEIAKGWQLASSLIFG